MQKLIPLPALLAAVVLVSVAGELAADTGFDLSAGEPDDPLYPQQWHHAILRTPEVWDSAGHGITGDGVLISVVDDGLDTAHQDFVGALSAPHLNVVNPGDQGATNPQPSFFNGHGTAGAGVAAARGDNGTGVTGVAPRAQLTGVRFIDGPASSEDTAAAFLHRAGPGVVSMNNWAHTVPYQPLTSLVEDALAQGSALGVIYVFAAGNSRQFGDRADKEVYKSTRFTIPVAAVGENLDHPAYSEEGACLVIAAPSSPGNVDDIVTTDNMGAGGADFGGAFSIHPSGNYSDAFGGSSAAGAVMAGVVALMLEANPNLTYREINDVLIRSARNTGLGPGISFETNGGGIPFSYQVGAGVVDAFAAVKEALARSENLPLVTAEARTLSFGAIADGDVLGVAKDFDFSAVSGQRVEHVCVDVAFTHSRLEDLQIELTAPSGMISVLNISDAAASPPSTSSRYSFCSVRHWGEDAAGAWTVRIADRVFNTHSGSIGDVTVTVYGHAPPANASPVLTSAEIIPGPMAYADEDLLVRGVAFDDPDGDEVTPLFQWEVSGDCVTWEELEGESGALLEAAVTSGANAYRCRVSGLDTAGNVSAVFLTPFTFVESRPVTGATVGFFYEYDADLWLQEDGAPGMHYVLAPATDPAAAAWLSIDPGTGMLSGTPPVTGSFTIEVAKAGFLESRVQAYVLTVEATAASMSYDGDGDGSSYLAEVAFHADPAEPDTAGIPTQGVISEGEERYLTITFTRLKGGTLDAGTLRYTVDDPTTAGQIRYRVECSGNLRDWVSGPVVVEELAVVDDPGAPAEAERVTHRTVGSIGEGGKFLKVVVEYLPAPGAPE